MEPIPYAKYLLGMLFTSEQLYLVSIFYDHVVLYELCCRKKKPPDFTVPTLYG